MGIATQFLAAEIKGAFDDLKREGAIKLTQVGEDEKLDALITTAYNKIAEIMFSPMGGTGTPDLSSLTGTGGQPSMLDRATAMLKENRTATEQQNEKIRAENKTIREENRADAERRRAAAEATTPAPASATGGSAKAAAGTATDAADDRPRGYRPRTPSLSPTYADEARPTDAPGSGGGFLKRRALAQMTRSPVSWSGPKSTTSLSCLAFATGSESLTGAASARRSGLA